MTHEDAPPEDMTGPYAAGAPHHDLWRRARAWVNDLLLTADDLPRLARIGVTRAFGRRLGLFVFTVEAAIRRLVLQLAFQLTPALAEARPRKPDPRRAAPVDAGGPRPIRVSFRFFALRGGSGKRTSAATPSARVPVSAPSLALARDPLLAIGPAPPPRGKRGPSRTRWTMLESPAARTNRYMLGPRKAEPGSFGCRPRGEPRRRKRNPPMLRQDRPVRTPRGLPHDHLIPAPGLARRIAALWNVINDPAGYAARAARRLARLAGGADTLRRAPDPVPPTLKGDMREPPALTLLWRSCDVLAGPNDTS